MSKNDELVLTIPRTELEKNGAFQGYTHGTTLLADLLSHDSWKFERRGDVEDDPSKKQLIPYCLILQNGKVLVYERGKSGGEAKLHAKKSLGIGGHINPQDKCANGWEQLQTALLRELEEELVLPTPPRIRYCGLLNDESDPVGQVHFGVIAIAEIGPGEILPGEAAISSPTMVEVEELEAHYKHLEGWSKIVVDAIHQILPDKEFHFDIGNSSTGPIGMCAVIVAKGEIQATTILKEELPEEIEVKSENSSVGYIRIYTNSGEIDASDCL